MDAHSAERPAGRRYSGRTTAERVEQRRTALLDAALELFGTQGYVAGSVKQLCGLAGLTERYFYESFRDRESCLAALYDDLTDRTRERTLTALRAAGPHLDAVIGAGLAAFIGYLSEDPRRARVVLVEVVGVSAAMEQRRHAVLRDYAELVAGLWSSARARPLSERERLTCIALVGGVNHLLVDWLLDNRTHDPAQLVEVCTGLFTAVRATDTTLPD
ncbi:TetR family transcriptional regulator [Nocardia mangyaensis]|uniref:TetR family transcriptional regulator n=1 Tax=Nocardia mangyaensis TaxID=2213200 RepID=A0A1J0VMJ2_9NOCA|nr:TetR/AcrR family transcriptional regulator [Nocardia mangyaensis]APE33230.1 TetR family transcriptional regulator [Nocardia mangyaensis]